MTQLVALAPNDPFPHLALADRLYEQDKLEEAAIHLAHATERLKNDPTLHSYLDIVVAKVRRAAGTGAGACPPEAAHTLW